MQAPNSFKGPSLSWVQGADLGCKGELDTDPALKEITAWNPEQSGISDPSLHLKIVLDSPSLIKSKARFPKH